MIQLARDGGDFNRSRKPPDPGRRLLHLAVRESALQTEIDSDVTRCGRGEPRPVGSGQGSLGVEGPGFGKQDPYWPS